MIPQYIGQAFVAICVIFILYSAIKMIIGIVKNVKK
jgi:hypothetical protein